MQKRGANNNVENRFLRHQYQPEPGIEEDAENGTQYLEVFPKTIVNKVNSPDVGMAYSMNPYQGCEHGCVYCYARPTHEYWGYSAGTDFERQILVKKNAPELLRTFLSKPKWQASPIVLSGNTDCYQPLERKLEITRKTLQVFWDFRHPVSIITKNALVLRDIDLLKKLSELDLVAVIISLTTLDESLRREMEPRTATTANRLKAIRTLSEAGIPVSVMTAPIIPGLNDHEIPELLKQAADNGAVNAGYTIVRLNDSVGTVFSEWIRKVYPDRADKVLNQVAASHGGSIEDKRKGKRMRGEGEMASIIHALFSVNKKKYFAGKPGFQHNLSHFSQRPGSQLKLF